MYFADIYNYTITQFYFQLIDFNFIDFLRVLEYNTKVKNIIILFTHTFILRLYSYVKGTIHYERNYF